jgi:hypothetical protein
MFMKNRRLPKTNKQAHYCCYKRDNGTQCKAHAQTANEYCFFHDPALQAERTAAARAGGIASTSKRASATVKPLRTPADVIELLSDTINQVRRGEIDPGIATSIGHVASVLLATMEGTPEQRLAALRAVAAAQPPVEDLFSDESTNFVFVPRSGEKPS